MTRKHLFTCSVIAFILAVAPAFGEDGISARLHYAFIEAEGPRSPFIVEDHVIFTYQQPGPARFVAVAFAHEDFTVMHPYKRYTPEGGSEIFILAYPIPSSVDTLIYRVIVDGLWMSDPANSNGLTDANGIRLSRYRIPDRNTINTYPLISNSGLVTFVYPGLPGQRLSVAGSFNGWDPFMYPLKETSPGRYEITLSLTPGEYVYHFLINGSAVSDPGNPRNRYDSDGNRFSFFSIEEPVISEPLLVEKKRLRDRIPFIK